MHPPQYYDAQVLQPAFFLAYWVEREQESGEQRRELGEKEHRRTVATRAVGTLADFLRGTQRRRQ